MKHQKIPDSSNVASVAHNPATGILEVKFHSGGVYQYANVTEKQHADLLAAESTGRYLNDHIVSQPKKHPYIKVNKR